jgi:RNA polymerase sigma-70 factor (sigma-E family)
MSHTVGLTQTRFRPFGGTGAVEDPAVHVRSSAVRGKERDEEFSRYVAARAHSLRSTAYLLCGDWHRAEDITQSALLKLYLAWRRLDHHGGLDAYSRRIVVRTFLAERRLLWRKREHVTDAPPDAPALGSYAEQRLHIQQALTAVPPRQRAVIVLRFWNDLSVEETAAALGCSVGTVKSQCARGLAKLRERLGPDAESWNFGGSTTSSTPSEGR